jgi:CelD/BcsL family acetyltransferase involved in cellulose biosynthesis
VAGCVTVSRASRGRLPAAAAGVEVKVFRERADVDELVSAWRALAERSGQSAFAFPSWALACFDGDDRFSCSRLRVVTVWSGNELVAVGPFAEELQGGLRIVRFLGAWRAQPNRIVVAPGHDHLISVVWDALRTPRTLLRLDELDDRLSGDLLDTGGRWASRTSSRSTCLTVDTSEPFEQYLQSGRTSLRQSLRSARRRIDEDGAAIDPLVVESQAGLVSMVPHIRAVESRSPDPARKEGILGQLAVGRLPMSLARAAADGRVQAQVLFADGQPFVYSVNLIGSGVVTGLLTGHDPAYRRYSPGHLCLAELYTWSHARDLSLDLSVGDFDYKRRWGSESYSVVNAVAAPNQLVLGLAARGGVALDRWRELQWKAKRRSRLRPRHV